ncbi:hypothetical protein ACIOG4_38855 [Streptomyces microflavus]|uniref:hypothetical protein n=1 Tax=Streptomyces microflavus TaxID=1919 RepID=UPI0038252FDE
MPVLTATLYGPLHRALRLDVPLVESVMGRREDQLCVMCTNGLLGGTAYVVDGSRRRGRRRRPARFLVCKPCYERGAPDPETGLTRAASTRQTAAAQWWDLAGRGPALPPQPCIAGCGLTVVRGAEPLMLGVTCSRACRTSLTRKRHGGQGSGLPCGACGEPVTTGRADSAYCNAACRQKAYRRRKTDRAAPKAAARTPALTRDRKPAPKAARPADPVPELLAALAPFVAGGLVLDISQALYRSLYRLHTAHLRGHDQTTPLARLAAMDPDRVKIPDTAAGRRLRTALHQIRPAPTPTRSRNNHTGTDPHPHP